MNVIRLVLPFPPSVNGYWRHIAKGPLAGRTLISSEGRKYRVDVLVALRRALGSRFCQVMGRLRVDIEARMPDRRRRDVDNLPKALFDALTHAGFWSDDNQVDDMRVWRSPSMGGHLIVTVEELPDMQVALLPAQPIDPFDFEEAGAAA